MKVKILTYNNIFVDTRKLDEGIYSTDLPSLYNLNETIERLTNLSIKYFGERSTNFINNLKQCDFKVYELKEIEDVN